MSSVLGFDYANFIIVDGDTLHTVASKGIPLIVLTIPLTAKSIVARTARTGETQLVPDTHLDPDFLRGTMDSRSELDVPIKLDGKTIAVLNAESLKPAAFTEEDAAAAELLATHAASAYQRFKNIEQLREVEELHRTILDNSPNPISITSEGDIVYANKRRLELTGAASLEQLIGQKGITFIHPDDRTRVQTRIRDFTSGKLVPERYEYRCLRPDGTYINIEANSAPINYRGKPALLHVLTDVTQLKKYEEQLTNLQGYARDLATAETLDEAARIIGRAVQGVIESSFGSIGFVEGDVLRFMYVYGVDWDEGGEMRIDGPGITTRAVRTGQTQLISDVTLDPDYYLTYSDNSTSRSEVVIPIKVNEEVVGVINVESTNKNAYTQNDVQILEMLGNHFSSTIQRIHAAETVKISEARYRTLFEGVSDAVIILKLDGHILEVNDVATQMLDRNREELLKLNLIEITSEADLALLPKRLETFQREGQLTFEVQYIQKNQTLSEAEVSIKKIELGGENVIFSVSHDISQRKKTERGLIALNKCAVDLASADNIDSIWDSAINALKNGFDYKWAGIAAVTGRYLKYVRFLGVPPPEGFTLPLSGSGITTRAIKTGESQLVTDIRTDGDYTTFPTTDGTYPMLSELAVPVKLNGKIMAAINIERATPNATRTAADATCQTRGHASHGRAYQGAGSRPAAVASTRGSRVAGARGAGSRFSSASIRCSRSTGSIENRQLLLQALAAAVNVGLHLPQRHAKHRGDCLVAHVLEVKQHQRHALVIRQGAQRALQVPGAIRLLQQRQRRRGRRQRRGLVAGIRPVQPLDLAEELPPGAVAQQVVQAQARGDRLQPSGRRGAGRNDGKPFERPKEDRLRDVLRLGRVAEQAHRGGKHHVLVLTYERLEPVGVGGCRIVGHWVTNPAVNGKFQEGRVRTPRL